MPCAVDGCCSKAEWGLLLKTPGWARLCAWVPTLVRLPQFDSRDCRAPARVKNAEQKLLYLSPQADEKPICDLPEIRNVQG